MERSHDVNQQDDWITNNGGSCKGELNCAIEYKKSCRQ